jgi:hypothetical protein
MPQLMPILALLALCLSASAGAAEPMKPDLPMKGEMKKDGMKRGDVAKAAQKKKKQMEEMMDGERARKTPAR